MRRWLALGLLLASATAQADVLLSGYHHIGDCSGGSCDTFTPKDPVSRANNLATPIKFHLSATTTITAVRLDSVIDLDDKLQIYIQDQSSSNTLRAGTLSGDTYTLSPSVVLSPGFYSIVTDGGCTTLVGGTYFPAACSSGNENDFGYASITLVSAQTSASVMLNQRRHAGDDNDNDDDYDTVGTNNPPYYYPDKSEGNFIDQTFTLSAARRLTDVRFRKLREVDSNEAVAVDGQSVGSLTDTGSRFENDPTTLSTSLLLLAGTHTLRVTAGGGGNKDDFSWDDIVMQFTDVPAAGSTGFFNAVEPGQNALTGVIKTKIAGSSAFSLDLYALNAFGTAVNTAYAGTATVDVLNSSDSSGPQDVYGCRSTWTVAQSLPSVTFAAGKATITPPWMTAGLRDARIKVTDSSTGAAGCSVDNFAIRPNTYASISVTHDTESTAGTTESLNNTGSSGLPRHKAGAPFTIQATAVAVGGVAATNYDGNPELGATALSPATIAGSAQVSVWNQLGSGAVRTDTAQYFEAGPVTLSLTGRTYASVDLADSSDAERFIGPATIDVGRFIPDHFALTAETDDPTFSTMCNTFTYVGQPFSISPAPFRASITAVTTTGTTTRNYTNGALYKLPANLPATTYPALSGTVSAVAAPDPDNTLTNTGDGVTRWELLPTSFVFARGAPVTGAPVVPFNAEVAIQLGALAETDGVNFSTTPARFKDPTAGNGIDFTLAGVPGASRQMRFGRMVVDNAYGAENLPLNVPLRTEYWSTVSGVQGFVRNVDDSCSLITGTSAPALAQAQLTGGISASTSVTAVNYAGSGTWNAVLAAPNTAGPVTVTGNLAALSWLQTDDADVDTLYNNNPVGSANFGVYKNSEHKIYQREVIR